MRAVKGHLRPEMSFCFKALRNKVNRVRNAVLRFTTRTKSKVLRDSKPRDWWRGVKQLCRASTPTGRYLKSLFHPDLICEDAALADKINQAFVGVTKDYSPLTNCVHVDMEDDRPIFVTELCVARKRREIKTSRAWSSDNRPNWMLKEFVRTFKQRS